MGTKRYINLILILTFLSVSIEYVTATTEWCFQETANISTSCGGLSTGTYRFTGDWSNTVHLFDGLYNTQGTSLTDSSFFYINYSKPHGVSQSPTYTNNTLWQVYNANTDNKQNLTSISN